MRMLRKYPARVAFCFVILVALLIWPELATDLLGSSGFEPHGFCFQWRGDILALHVTSDTIIGVSYMGISYYLGRKVWYYRHLFTGVPIWLGLAFGGFIFFCGLTHFMGVATLWYPFYWVDGGIKALTATASVATFVGLILFNQTIDRSIRAGKERDDLLYEQLKAVTGLQAALQSREGDLLELTREIGTQRTERSALIETLTRSNDRFTRLFRLSPAAKVLTRMSDGVVIDANLALLDLFGYSYEEVIGKRTSDLWHYDDESQRTAILTALEEHKRVRNFEARLHTDSGRDVTVLFSIELLAMDNELCAASIAIDITERKRVEEQLRQSEERYRLITENSTDLIQVIDLEARGRVVYASPSHASVFGRPLSEIVGTLPLAEAHREDRERAAQLISEVLRRGEGYVTLRLPDKQGNWHWIEASVRALNQDGKHLAVVVGRDITDRKRIEQQFIQAQKMESIGRLAGGIAHDFNNLLTTILGLSELTLNEDDLSGAARRDVTEIQKAARRATQVTRQLLSFARQQIIELQVIDLNTQIVEVGKMLGRLIPANTELVVLPAQELAAVKADAGQIEQVLLNLIVNARDAMPSGGKIIVETANILLDETYVRQHAYVHPGAYVMLSVTDTGTGMTEEVQSHIFEPFYTTKDREKGTGLGLATVYGIVKQHRGYVWIYSEVGVGTSVKIYLPMVEEALDALPLPNSLLIPRGTETILIAEDEESLRTMASRILRNLGYTVLEAANGEDAMQIAIERATAGKPDPIDLLLTDIIMPKMGGKLLADRFAALFKRTRVLFMSGYTDNTITHAGILDPGLNFLGKPFTSLGLAQKVRQVLDIGKEDQEQAQQIDV